MALWKFVNLNKHGNFRTRIIHSETSALTIGQGFGDFVGASRFHYESRTPYHGLMTSPVDGKKYLTPDWVVVVPETTLEDIVHIPVVKVEIPKEKNEWMFESSSSPGLFYKVNQSGDNYKCNCPGVWRAKDGQCRHMKEVMQELNIK